MINSRLYLYDIVQIPALVEYEKGVDHYMKISEFEIHILEIFV